MGTSTGSVVHEYRTGTWIAIVNERSVAVLHPELGVAAARDLWRLTRSGSRLGTWVEHLATRGIRTLPSFAMVEARPEGLGILVRGDLSVQVGGETISAAGFTTWREAVLPGDDFTISGAGTASADEETWLPVGAGIALVSALRSVGDDGDDDLRAGLQVAAEPADQDEEDLELTLMKAPALAAAIGRTTADPESPAAEPVDPTAGHGPSEAIRAPDEREAELTRPPEDDEAVTGTTTAPTSGIISEVPWARHGGSSSAVPLPGGPTPPIEPAAVPPSGPVVPGTSPDAAGAAEGTYASTAGEGPYASTSGEGTYAGMPAAAEPVPAWDEGDHDGETVMPSELPELPDDAAATPYQEPFAEPPAQGLQLLMSTGTAIAITQPLLLGRAPESSRFRGSEVPRLVTVTNPERDISGTHVEIRPAGDHVVVTDMNSTNGTVVFLPGQPSFRLHPGSGVPVPPGGVIEIGTGVTATVMAGGEGGT
ncbi:FHA domain-containing protein [Georgenia alba]|uniref:FHA domain-containing protein n=1 Tax=Georgenia alba TaxID=2233858 RepID=A0ABW2QA29_9MICO